jgi:gluconolactonase
MSFAKFHPSFEKILGPNPRVEICLQNTIYPFAHEAGVCIPSVNEVWVTSNRFAATNDEETI